MNSDSYRREISGRVTIANSRPVWRLAQPHWQKLHLDRKLMRDWPAPVNAAAGAGNSQETTDEK